MPELPEVETTRRGVAPAVEGRRIIAVRVRERRLRWPLPVGFDAALAGARVRAVGRRAKYLLFDTEAGTLLVHLGMSGSLRVLPAEAPPLAHDHIDLVLDSGACLRFNDPRRFGSLLLVAGDPAAHPLLAALAPEPLSTAFDGPYLHARTRGRRVAIKPLLMNARIVVGVGNIYASEALFHAGIRPGRAAGGLTRTECGRLAHAVKVVLGDALAVGGTTLRDYVHADGTPGHFRQRLQVYARAGAPCRACTTPVRVRMQGRRATYWCPTCQQ